jgi:hypothetical protein
MPNHQVLDNITHQNLKVITQQHPDYGDTQSYSGLILSEIAAAQADYPLFFRQSESSGNFELVALQGLAESENLYLDENGWHAHYLPLSVKRRPFLIGFQNQNGQQAPVVHVDMDSPRISEEKGESVFMPHGGQSGYLQEVGSILNALHSGHQEVQDFVGVLQAYKLIEPVDLNIELNNKEKIQIQTLQTINEDNLAMLTAEAIYALHQKGYLKHIYMLIASVANLSKLIEKKNARLA